MTDPIAALRALDQDGRAERLALVNLLVRKGLFTHAEWSAEVARTRAIVPAVAAEPLGGFSRP